MLGEQVSKLLVSLAVGVWIARLLGPDEFGRLSYAIAFSAIFGVLATLGLNRLLVREIVSAGSDTTKISQLMTTAILMRIGAGWIVFLVCLAAAWILNSKYCLLIALVSGSIIFSAADCIDLYFQSQMKARLVAKARLTSFVIATLLRIMLIYLDAGVIAFAAVILFEYIGSAVALLLVYRRYGPVFSRELMDIRKASTLIRESWPEIIAGFGGMLFLRLDQVMLEHLSGSQLVGEFAVAARISEIWYFIPVAIVASIFPKIVESRSKNESSYHARLQLLTTGLVLLAYLVIISTTLVADWIIPWMYGVGYVNAGKILIIQIWCGLFLVFAQTSGAWIVAEKRMRLNLYRSLLGCLVNVIANFYLIPLFGGRGAAMATLMSFIFAYFLFDFIFPQMRQMAFIKLKALLLFPAWKELGKI